MATATATSRPVPLSAWLRPVAPRPQCQAVPGHNRWHPGIPAVAELISGGSVRLECEAGTAPAPPMIGPAPEHGRTVPDGWEGPCSPVQPEPVLCGPLSIVGAEPGDVIVVDILGIGRADGRYAAAAHPGIIGCAPAVESLTGPGRAGPQADSGSALLGRLLPDVAGYRAVAAEAVQTAARGPEIGGCDTVRLTPGRRILLPVHAHGAKLSVGALHFPMDDHEPCAERPVAGWIDLRVNLTKRGVERFGIRVPTPITGHGTAA